MYRYQGHKISCYIKAHWNSGVACTAAQRNLYSDVKTRQICFSVVFLQNEFPPYRNIKITSYCTGGCAMLSMPFSSYMQFCPHFMWLGFQRCLISLQLFGLHFHFFIEEWDVSLKYLKEQSWTMISSDSIYSHCIILVLLFNDAVSIGTKTITLKLLEWT